MKLDLSNLLSLFYISGQSRRRTEECNVMLYFTTRISPFQFYSFVAVFGSYGYWVYVLTIPSLHPFQVLWARTPIGHTKQWVGFFRLDLMWPSANRPSEQHLKKESISLRNSYRWLSLRKWKSLLNVASLPNNVNRY